MSNQFSYKIVHRDQKTHARTGIIHTEHGDIETPAFVPVGTQASVKSLTPEDLMDLDTHLFFVNTYHVYLRPGTDVMKKSGGLHKFMNWNRPLITDSGGFQVFSLGRNKFTGSNKIQLSTIDSGNQYYLKISNDITYNSLKNDRRAEPSLVKISDDGVRFRSHWDGSEHMFTPENSMEYQWQLGSDIHIAFDDCTGYPVTHKQAQKSLTRTHEWAVRSLDAHKKIYSSRGDSWKSREVNNVRSRMRSNSNYYQALYGSIQGSVYEDLRKQSAKFIAKMDFDGMAIGGVSVGESKQEMRDVLDWVVPFLPEKKPRHLLGVGEIDDIFTLVEHGIDTFDCVQPTRLARMGHVYNSELRMPNTEPSKKKSVFHFDINKAVYKSDMKPIDPLCTCYTCQNFSRAYIHHLFHVRELLVYRLATIHNIHFINTLMTQIRKSIEEHAFLELKSQWFYNG